MQGDTSRVGITLGENPGGEYHPLGEGHGPWGCGALPAGPGVAARGPACPPGTSRGTSAGQGSGARPRPAAAAPAATGTRGVPWPAGAAGTEGGLSPPELTPVGALGGLLGAWGWRCQRG